MQSDYFIIGYESNPLSNFYSPLYRHTTVHNIPVPFYKTANLDEVKHCVVKYELEAGLLMFSKNKEECALLSENNYMCSRHKFYFCNPKAIIYPTNMNKLCVVVLFMKDQSDVKRFCKQILVLNRKLPLARYLTSGIWLIVTNENLNFTVNCQSGDTGSKEVHVEVPLGILHLNNTCRASNRYWRLLGFFDRSSTFEKSDALKPLLKLRKMTHTI